MSSPVDSHESGFTLIELMVVIVLISIVTALAMPRLDTSFFSDDLKNTARKLVGLVVQVGQEAVRSQTEYLLIFNLEENSIVARQETGEEDAAPGGWSSELAVPDSVKILDISSFHGGKQNMGSAVIRFSHKGYVDKTYIHLHADDNRDMTIMLSPFLGATRLSDSYVEMQDDRIQ